jgi:perosamine synthetase
MADRIPVAGPWITEKEIEYVDDAVRNAWYSSANMYHTRFETAFAEYVGRQYAIALPSCTSAIHLSLLALDLTSEHEVIVPDITWIATAAPISYMGAAPVFADIDPDSWCISAESFEQNISPNTRAVIVVDLYGSLPDMGPILEIANHHGIAVIEDAAQSIGAEYGGRKAGSFGLASTFSFHGTKTLTTGEGGMFLTDDGSVYERCQYLRDHGTEPGDKRFWNTEIAHKYKMSSMQAALGLAQLERVEELIERKRQIFSWYQEQLGDVEGVVLNSEPTGVTSTFWMVTAVVDPSFEIRKEEIMQAMSDRGIDTRPFFYPLSSLPAYSEFPQSLVAQEQNTNSYAISSYGVNLPSGFNMTQENVFFVCEQFKQVLGMCGKLSG